MNIMKKIITESDIKNLVYKSVNKILNEMIDIDDEYPEPEETPLSEAMNDLESAMAALGAAQEDNMKLPNKRMNRFVMTGMSAAEDYIKKAIRALKQAENSYRNGER